MLEQMRRQGASIFIYLIFGILIAVFIINFGPQRGNRQDVGCRGVENQVVSVDGSSPTRSAYIIAYANPYNRGEGKQRVYTALEWLISREILANEAETHHLIVTDDLINDQIMKGYFFLAGHRLQPESMYEIIDGEKNFSRMRNWFAQFSPVSKGAYIEEQKRGLLAVMMAELLEASVQVSRDEALQRWLFENNTVTYDVVAFRPDTFRAVMKVTDADVDRFVASHEEEVKARYKQDERTYKAVKPQLKLRQMVGDKDKLEAVKAGKQKFDGEDLGWHTADNAMLGDKAVSDAVKTLKPGEMTPVITTGKGAYLLIADDKREGDLSFDQVKREIAIDLAKDAWSKEAAKRAALAALKGAQSGIVHDLDKLYDHEAREPGPNIDIEKILNDPNMTQEQKQQLLQMLLQQQKHGMLEIEGKDQPAGWFEDDQKTAGSGSAAGSGAPTPAPAPAPAPAKIEASTEVLPQMGEVAKAKVQRFGPAPRSATMPGVGKSKEAGTALFDELKPGDLASQVYDAEGAYVVVQLVGRSQPQVAEFDKEAEKRVEELRAKRAQEFLGSWIKERCEQLYKDGKILPNPELTRESDDKGNPLPPKYRPCMYLR